MRSSSFVRFLLALGAAACSSALPSATNTDSLQGTWASDQVTLIITDSSANLELLASGGCFGSYGQIPQAVPPRHFSIPGTYTQLIGAFPGKVDYPAQYSGRLDGPDLVLTITVPTLPLSIGPIHLTAGRKHDWSACLYPSPWTSF
jgi:hypothetical protein